jgi:hypothetical protein
MKNNITINSDVSIFTFYSDYFNRNILKSIRTSLKLLNIDNKCGSKPEVNPTRKPCYIFYEYIIIVETKNEEVLKDLFVLTDPKIQYLISQRRGKIRAKV